MTMSDKPKRGSLTAYNLFLKFENEKRVCANIKLGRSQIVKEASSKWKSISENERKPYFDAALIEQKRYRTAMAKWKEENKRKKNDEASFNDRDTVVSGNHVPSSTFNSYKLQNESKTTDCLRRLLTIHQDTIELHHNMMHSILQDSNSSPSSEVRQKLMPITVHMNPNEAFDKKKYSTALDTQAPLGNSLPYQCHPEERHSPFHQTHSTRSDDNWMHSIGARSTREFDGCEENNPVPLSTQALVNQNSSCAISDLAFHFDPYSDGFDHKDVIHSCFRRDHALGANNNPSPLHLNIDQFCESPFHHEVFPSFHEVLEEFKVDQRRPSSVMSQMATDRSDRCNAVHWHHALSVSGINCTGHHFPVPNADEMEAVLRVFDD